MLKHRNLDIGEHLSFPIIRDFKNLDCLIGITKSGNLVIFCTFRNVSFNRNNRQ